MGVRSECYNLLSSALLHTSCRVLLGQVIRQPPPGSGSLAFTDTSNKVADRPGTSISISRVLEEGSYLAFTGTRWRRDHLSEGFKSEETGEEFKTATPLQSRWTASLQRISVEGVGGG